MRVRSEGGLGHLQLGHHGDYRSVLDVIQCQLHTTHTHTHSYADEFTPKKHRYGIKDFSASLGDVFKREEDGQLFPLNSVFNLSHSFKLPNCGQSCVPVVQKSTGYLITGIKRADHSIREQLQSIIFYLILKAITVFDQNDAIMGDSSQLA